MKIIETTRYVAEGLMEQFPRAKEVQRDSSEREAVGIFGLINGEIDTQLLFSYVAGQYGDQPTINDEQEASDQIKGFMSQIAALNGASFVVVWEEYPNAINLDANTINTLLSDFEEAVEHPDGINMAKEYDGKMDAQIEELVENLKKEFDIADETKLREHLFTYPSDYPDCTIDNVRSFAYEYIDEYLRKEPLFGLKETVDSLEPDRSSGPKFR